MQSSILRTKLQRPPVAPDIVPRARLLDRLEAGRQRPLTLISAPAGYGKSTLASRWVDVCDCPSGWISLDKGDGDLQVFLNYLLAAIRPLFPDATFRSEALLEIDQMPAAANLASQLLNDLHAITTPFILVLDDFHHIVDTPVQDLIVALLTHPSQSMHLVLATRRDPPLPIATMRGRSQITEIRATELRFTPAEAGAFLTNMLNVAVDEATAALLDAKTEGWATGLRLAGLYLQDKTDLNAYVQQLSGSSRHIAEYLVTEVLSRQHPEFLTRLMEISILDRFCAPLCRAMHTGTDKEGEEQAPIDAQRFIQWLVASNLFVIPLDDQGYWFRYHHLFQAFLRAQLRSQAGVEKIAALHMKASNWFAGNNLIEEAVQYALTAENTKEAVRLVVAHRHDLMNDAHFHRLNHWLAMLPNQVLDEEPLLVTTRAFMALRTGQVKDFLVLTEQARCMSAATVSNHPAKTTHQGEVAAAQCIAGSVVGHDAETLSAGQTALELLPRQSLYIRCLVFASMAEGHQMQGHLGRAVALIDEALSMHGLPEESWPRILFYAGIIHFLDANSSGLFKSGRKALHLMADSTPNHTRGGVHYFMGATHYLRNELADAKSHLLDVLEVGAVTNPTYVAHASGLLAFLALAEGAPTTGDFKAIEFDTENDWVMQSTNLPAIRDAFRVEVALRQGKIDEARRLSAGVDFDSMPLIWFMYVAQLTPIKLQLAEGSEKGLKAARTHLVEMDEKMRKINRKSIRINILALLALVCHKLDEETVALENLKTALDLAEPGGWIRNFLDLGEPMFDLLAGLIQIHPDHGYAQLVLEAFRAEARRDLFTDASGKKTPDLAGQPPVSILTKRETDLLLLLAEGMGNKEIAANLHIAPETVKTHLQNIYRKLDAKGRIGAIKAARGLGLIPRE